MKSIIVSAVLVAFALSASTSFAAYNGAKNYESRPAAAKASPASSHSFNGKTGGKASKSSFKSGGYKSSGFKSGGVRGK